MDSQLLVLLLMMAGVSSLAQPCLDDKGKPITSCQSCLMAPPACGWCLEQTSPPSLARGCELRENSDCMSWYKDDEGEHDRKEANSKDYIKPRGLTHKLRPNKAKKIKFQAKKKDSPVDMYFLLDLTGSMSNIKNKLEDITVGLMEVRIRSNYKLPTWCLSI